MNRYPLWKYAILVVALLIGLIYTAPNLFGEAPAVQVSSAKATLRLDASFAPRVQQLLEQAGLKPDLVQFDGNSVKARLADTDAQIRAKDALTKAIPMRRLGKPQEVADAIVFFSGAGADYVTGQVLSVSGGLTMVG